jgi:hypothetical protein
MSTIVINVDDKSSAKLFLDLAKKLHFKATILTDAQKEDWALLVMMKSREKELALPIESALEILNTIKSK